MVIREHNYEKPPEPMSAIWFSSETELAEATRTLAANGWQAVWNNMKQRMEVKPL